MLSREIVYERVTVRVGPRTQRVELLSDGRLVGRQEVAPGPRVVQVPIAPGPWTLRARAVGAGGARTSTPPTAIWSLPTSARRPGRLGGWLDTGLQRDVERISARSTAITGVYVQHLLTGCGAALNAGARFPAASTLKLAILVQALRRGGVDPWLLDRMIIDSDDRASNQVLAQVGGPTAVTATALELGLGATLVRRPYIVETARRRPIPITTTASPALYTNYVSTPRDLAALLVAVHRGALGRGGLQRVGITPARARREALVRLLRVRDRTKLAAGLPGAVALAHKSGYTTQTKHDAGIAYLRSGPVVMVVMSWSQAGVSDAARRWPHRSRRDLLTCPVGGRGRCSG